MDSQLEQIDQEIIRYLQKIDINLNESFKIITQDIIPDVRKYGQACDNIMDNCQWLITMFEQTSNVQLFGNDTEIEKNEVDNENERSIFPNIISEGDNSNNINDNTNNDNEDDFHTANITTTGQILQLPEFSDDENEDGSKKSLNEIQKNNSNNNNNSTLQRQNRKRKVSLLLQQQYGSNSSSIPSPIIQSKTRKVNDGIDEEDGVTNENSSPVKNDIHNSTILEFPTAE